MDSAYEWNLLLYLKSASILVVVVGILAALAAFGGCLAKTIAYFNGFSDATALTRVGIALIALTPVMGLLLFFTSWRPVPGAFDNLSAVSVVAGLGQYIGEAKRSEVWFPERTEVVLLATSSEEAGHRGAKRYVKRHTQGCQVPGASWGIPCMVCLQLAAYFQLTNGAHEVDTHGQARGTS